VTDIIELDDGEQEVCRAIAHGMLDEAEGFVVVIRTVDNETKISVMDDSDIALVLLGRAVVEMGHRVHGERHED
jgi:hypothetical protein